MTATAPVAGGAVRSIRSGVPGPDFYDSYLLLYRIYLNTDFWNPVAALPDTVVNSFNGAVGIGVNPPTVALDVGGDVTAPSVRSTQYCNAAGTKCFAPAMIGGTGITCHGESMLGIKDGTSKCTSSSVTITPGSLPIQTCPAGQFVVGINAGTGAFICQP